MRSLEDSLVRYELLKPATYNLQQTNVQREKENQELRMQLRIMSFSGELEKASFAKQLEAERRKRKRTFALIGLAVVTGLLIR